MISRNRGIFVIFTIVAIAVAVLAIPEIRISAFGNTVSRGNDDTVLGLSFGLDLRGGTHLVYKVIPEGGGVPSADDMEAIRRTIERRVNEFGVSEATVQELGTPADRILVQFPGQSGASLNISFNGGAPPEVMEEFFRTSLGRADAEVRQENDGSLTIRLEEIRTPVIDALGNVIEPGEADLWRPQIEERFPATILIGFVPQLVEEDPGADPAPEPTATPEGEATPVPEPPETTVPTLEEVEQAFARAGFEDATISELAEGFFQVGIVGLKQGGIDDEGNRARSDGEIIIDEMNEIGVLGSFDSIGEMLTYTVAGGVEEAKQLIGSTARLEFRERICGSLTIPEGEEDWPPDGLSQEQWLEVRCVDPQYYTEQATDIESDDLIDAFAGIQPGSPRPVVNIVFNDKGGDAFFELTDRIARNRDVMAIYLDGVELVSPGAQQGIAGGRAIIQGPDFTAERTRTIAIQLRSGALPADLLLVQERSVDATLGEESLRKSLIAGAVGLTLLLVFMAVYYKVPGILAGILLIMYAVTLLAIFKLIPVTLTLSGAAAMILSLGFAVDANILIAERIKEELRTGRNLLPAINAGFDRAWPSIRDGNLSTIITAVVLFWFGDRFGTSIMQGFALTLGIGVLLSMFTAFFATRVLLRLVARTRLGDHLALFVPVRDLQSAGQGAEG